MKKYPHLIIGLITILASCLESPQPESKLSGLDSVKNVILGQWQSSSVTVTELSTGNSARSNDCNNAPFVNAEFTNTLWESIVGEIYFTVTSSESWVGFMCVQNANEGAPPVITQLSSGIFKIHFDLPNLVTNVLEFQIKTSEITPNLITMLVLQKSTLTPSSSGYNVEYQFVRQ
jgi:hypothetical protein